MTLVVGLLLIVLSIGAFILRTLGWRVPQFLPKSGKQRIYVDVAMIATLLLGLAMIVGVHRSFGAALAITLASSIGAIVLQEVRERFERSRS